MVLMCGDGQMADAVDYLRAMRPGTRTSIFAAMKSEEDMQLASALLKSLRVPPSAIGWTPRRSLMQVPPVPQIQNDLAPTSGRAQSSPLDRVADDDCRKSTFPETRKRVFQTI